MKLEKRIVTDLPIINVYDDQENEIEMLPFIAASEDEKVYAIYTKENELSENIPVMLNINEDKWELEIIKPEGNEELLENLYNLIVQTISEALEKDLGNILDSLDTQLDEEDMTEEDIEEAIELQQDNSTEQIQ